MIPVLLLIFRAVNVPLARWGQHACLRAVVVALISLLGLDMAVDGVRNRPVRSLGLVLVDQRGSLAVVPHPRHEVPQFRVAGRGEGVARMAQIMEVKALRGDWPHRLWPRRHLVEAPRLRSPSLLLPPRLLQATNLPGRLAAAFKKFNEAGIIAVTHHSTGLLILGNGISLIYVNGSLDRCARAAGTIVASPLVILQLRTYWRQYSNG